MTPALQALAKLGVAHRVHRYELKGDEGVSYGEAVAAALGSGHQYRAEHVGAADAAGTTG